MQFLAEQAATNSWSMVKLIVIVMLNQAPISKDGSVIHDIMFNEGQWLLMFDDDWWMVDADQRWLMMIIIIWFYYPCLMMIHESRWRLIMCVVAADAPTVLTGVHHYPQLHPSGVLLWGYLQPFKLQHLVGNIPGGAPNAISLWFDPIRHVLNKLVVPLAW